MDYTVVEKLNDRLASAESENKRLRLTFMKAVAGTLLAIFIILFVITTFYRSAYPWLGYVKAFSEAAMVGAMADWFAVVALFRHPFGLPIPHTAIIPASKKRIAESLGDFIKNNFLSTSKILEKIRGLDIAGRLVSFLESDEGARWVSSHLATGLSKVLSTISNDKVADFVRAGIKVKLGAMDVASLAGGSLDLLTRNQAHQALLDYAIDELDKMLASEDVKEAITERAVKGLSALKYVALDRIAANALAKRIIDGSVGYVNEVKQDKNHPLRQRFNKEVIAWADRLRRDPYMKFKGEQFRDRILDSEEVNEYFSNLWTDLSSWLLNDVNSSHSQVREKIFTSIQDMAKRLAGDDELKDLIDTKIIEIIPGFVEKYKDSIGDFISRQIMEWDDQFMVDQLELSVGKDLQFIRINGTIVGGFIGLAIYIISGYLG